MKNKALITVTLIAAVIMLSSLSLAVLKSSGPPSCHAGEPPNFTTCTSCHTGNPVNSGTAQLVLDLGGAEQGYEHGKTYDIRISIAKAGLEAAGFQVIGLQDNDITKSPGVITLTQPQRTQIIDKNNPHSGGCAIDDKVWVEHTYDGSTPDSAGKSSWTFRWKAPDTDAGDITFYLASIEADHDLTEEGDRVYTHKMTIGNKTAGLKKAAGESFRLYPNPAGREVFVSAAFPVTEVAVLSIEGRLMKKYTPDGLLLTGSGLVVRLDGLANGIYLVRVTGEAGSRVQKLHVQR